MTSVLADAQTRDLAPILAEFPETEVADDDFPQIKFTVTCAEGDHYEVLVNIDGLMTIGAMQGTPLRLEPHTRAKMSELSRQAKALYGAWYDSESGAAYLEIERARITNG